jgi:hypothetical protein
VQRKTSGSGTTILRRFSFGLDLFLDLLEEIIQFGIDFK